MQPPLRRFFAPYMITAIFLAAQPARAEVTHHPINATGVGRITSATSTETDTESQIIGGGIIHGTTVARLLPTSFDPTTGIETYEGVLVLTTRHGTLTLYVFDGVFNVVTGEFSNNSQVTAGTGRFDGAAGGLYLHGYVAADGSFIDDEISGDIWVDLP